MLLRTQFKELINQRHLMERKFNQCKQHWHTINRLCNKFNGCYTKFEGRSGFNESRIMEEAHELYKAIYNLKFPYDHVWNDLKDQPKWKDECERNNGSKRMKVSEEGTYSSSSVNLDDDEEVEEVRPMGQKAAKKLEFAKRKGKSVMSERVTSDQDSETASRIHSIEEARLNSTTMLMKTKEREWEVQLATADTSKMSSIQRKFYDLKVKEMALQKGWNLEDEDEGENDYEDEDEE